MNGSVIHICSRVVAIDGLDVLRIDDSANGAEDID